MMKNIFLFIAVVIMNVATYASDIEDTRTRTFDPAFHSLLVRLDGNYMFPPIITRGNDDHITVSFDELKDDRSYLRYTLVHCDADWKPSGLVDSEFVDGFNYADIEDYEFSSGTLSQFVHYQFTLPNEQMQPLISGNYLVRVYREEDPDDVVLQARFMVCENEVKVPIEVTSRTDIDYNDRHQQLSIKVDTRNYRVQNMYNDLKLRITQNQRPDTEVALSAPMMVNGNVAVFDHMKQLVFTAGNEYRRIETVATNYLTMGVEAVEYFHPLYHVTLRTDLPRADEPYLYDQTQHGRYFIRNAEADNSATCADYMVTHFILNTAGPVQGGKIYLNGEFTHNLFSPTTLMKYDAATGCYTCDLLLKQGAYNYQYLFVPDGSTAGLTARIEGDKYQTVNEYLVRVYHRRQGERYDRFIGYGIAFSGR